MMNFESAEYNIHNNDLSLLTLLSFYDNTILLTTKEFCLKL